LPLAAEEAAPLFHSLLSFRHCLLAVSGGTDSLALMVALAEWAKGLKGTAPALSVATVDHGLRPEAREEAQYVARVAAGYGLVHKTLEWSGEKPKAGLQEAAREARYDLLSAHARSIGADAVLLAHQAEDQAETVLIRLCAGSGITGLSGMKARTEWRGLTFFRPFINVPRARLAAMLAEKGILPINDPSNTDPRFTRVRFRRAAAFLAEEGLDTGRLTMLSRRMARADAALAEVADKARLAYALPAGEGLRFAPALWDEPEEIILRVMAGALSTWRKDQRRDLAGVEAVFDTFLAARGAGKATRRNLGGVIIALKADGTMVFTTEKRSRA
jgi:tRNA(Ile)-lysidine synthase